MPWPLLASTSGNYYKSQEAEKEVEALGAEESMAKAQKFGEEEVCNQISTCIPGIGIHIFVPMILVSLALIIRNWEFVMEALLSSNPVCCFREVELRRPGSGFLWLLCNIIIVLLSIESGLLCANSDTDEYGDSSSFVKECEIWPKQQNVLEGTGMESRAAPGKIKCINSISMTVTVTQSEQPEQKRPAAKRTRSGNGKRGCAQGRGHGNFYMELMVQDQPVVEYEPMAQVQPLVEYEPIAQAQPLVEYEPMAQAQAQAQARTRVTVDGSSDELKQKCDDFISKVHHQIRFS